MSLSALARSIKRTRKETKGAMTTGEFAQKAGISDNTALRRLNALAAAGQARRCKKMVAGQLRDAWVAC